jgi:aspartate/methionine/tyrosine aminotransferase
MSIDTRGLSRRAQDMLAGGSEPEYLRRHSECLSDLFDPVTNPDGYIALCEAENRLVAEMVADRLDRVPKVPPTALFYDTMTGALRFREQLASFMGRTFLGREFDPQQISVLAGAGSVLEILFHALGDPGDGVLVPTPSYAGFWMDLELRNSLTIVPAHRSSDDDFRLTSELLDRAVAGAGRPVKALLYTSPDNPLGTVASPEEISMVLAWADDRDLHVVFDEIYALSVFGDRAFTSCAELLPSLGERVHIVWAFSKDFGASGLRCGVLVSENQAVIAAVDALAYWACCSGHTQNLLGDLISDETWVDSYVGSMRDLLRGAYASLMAALDAGRIRHLTAEAGVFVLLDLRPHLEAPTWEAEHALWVRILEQARVNLTPGAACRVGEPGFFRLCYAGLPPETVEAGVRRIVRLLKELH